MQTIQRQDTIRVTQPNLVAIYFVRKGKKKLQNTNYIHTKNGYEIELRISEPEEQKIYAIGLLLKNNTIYVQCVREAPELIDGTLHYWDPLVT